MRNYVQEGKSLTFSAPSTTGSGDPVLAGNLFGVAVHAAATGEDLTVSTVGVYTLDKASAAAFTVGEEIWFDPATKTCVEKSSGKHLIGVATVDAANGTTSVDVRLNGTSTTVAA